MKITAKEMFEGDFILTRVKQGYSNLVQVSAKRRNRKDDKPTIGHAWITKDYANKLSIQNFGKKITELRCYEY